MKFERGTGLREDGSKGHLMVVETLEFINEEFSPIVTEYGFKIVATASDASDSLRLYKKHCNDIDLVLIGLDLPHQDGIALLEKIRAADMDARIIVIVSEDRTALVRQALALGAVNFIIKPIENDGALLKIWAAIR